MLVGGVIVIMELLDASVSEDVVGTAMEVNVV